MSSSCTTGALSPFLYPSFVDLMYPLVRSWYLSAYTSRSFRELFSCWRRAVISLIAILFSFFLAISISFVTKGVTARAFASVVLIFS